MELNVTAVCVTACTDYRRLLLPGTIQNIAGRVSVIEGRLDISAGDYGLTTMSVLVLDFSNESQYSINNIQSSYIALRDRSLLHRQMRNIFSFMDITAQPGSGQYLFETDATPEQHTHTLMFLASGTKYWIQCTSAAPTA